MLEFKYKIPFFVALLSTLLLCAKSLGQPATLKFVAVESAPYAYVDEAGKLSGVIVDIAQAISEEANIPFEIDMAPASRVVKDLESGSIDLSILTRDAQIDKIALDVAPISDIRILLIRLNASQELNNTQQAPDNQTVGLIRGAQYSEELGAYLKDNNLDIYPVNNAEAGLGMLQRHRISYLLISEYNLRYRMSKGGLLDQYEVVRAFEHPSTAMYLSKQASAELSAERLALQQAIERLHRDEVIKQKLLNLRR